jgi:signal transduction histidine kinase
VLLAGVEGVIFARGGSWVPEIFLTVGPWVAGRIVRSRQAMISELEQSTDALERQREAFARLAVRRERARIARELHDIVSHNMAVMVIQAGAGRVASAGDPAAAIQRFRQIRAAGQAVLAEMDQLVDVLGLHGDSGNPSTLGGVSKLVGQARAAGLDVTAEVLITDSFVPPEVEHAAYRAIQEGLTNVLKHAPGSHVELRLSTHGGELEI